MVMVIEADCRGLLTDNGEGLEDARGKAWRKNSAAKPTNGCEIFRQRN